MNNSKSVYSYNIAVAVAAALMISACGPIVQIGAKTPPAQSLLLIEADTTTAPQLQDTVKGTTLAVELPQLPSTLQTLRLAVRTSDNEIQYLPAASWAEIPSRLVQRLISDTLGNSGIVIIDRSQASARADVALSGTLREFALDVRNPSGSSVVVRFDAQLTRTGTPRPIAIRRFDASEPVRSEAPVDVAAALSRATNRLAAELSIWTSQSL